MNEDRARDIGSGDDAGPDASGADRQQTAAVKSTQDTRIPDTSVGRRPKRNTEGSQVHEKSRNDAGYTKQQLRSRYDFLLEQHQKFSEDAGGTVSRFQNVLKTSHEGFLRALGDVLQIADMEPLLSVYRNCVAEHDSSSQKAKRRMFYEQKLRSLGRKVSTAVGRSSSKDELVKSSSDEEPDSGSSFLGEDYRSEEEIDYSVILTARFPQASERLVLVRDIVGSMLLSGTLDARGRSVLATCADRGFDVSAICVEIWEKETGGALFQILKSEASSGTRAGRQEVASASSAGQEGSATSAAGADSDPTGSDGERTQPTPAADGGERRRVNSLKYWKVGAGVVGGSVLLAVTGGLAAPALVAGLPAVGAALGGATSAVVGAVGGAGAAAMVGGAVTGVFASTAGMVAALGGPGAAAVFGATGAGLTGYKLGKRFGDLQEFVFVPMTDEHKVVSVQVFGNFNHLTRVQLFFANGKNLVYGAVQQKDGGFLMSLFDGFDAINSSEEESGRTVSRAEDEAAQRSSLSQSGSADKKHMKSANKSQAFEPLLLQADEYLIGIRGATSCVEDGEAVGEETGGAEGKSGVASTGFATGSTSRKVSSSSRLPKVSVSTHLGYSLEFVTNTGRTKTFSTTGSYVALSKERFEFMAPDQTQVVGLRFRRNKLSGIDVEPVSAQTTGESGAVQLALYISGWLQDKESQGGSKPTSSSPEASSSSSETAGKGQTTEHAWETTDASQLVTDPWRAVAAKHQPHADHFALRWETTLLLKLGSILGEAIRSYVGETAANLWVRSTVTAAAGASVAGAIVWPWWIVSTMKNLDNEWIVVKEKAKLAGQALAHAIADKQAMGQRPVFLCGHSMGARVVYYCLQELHEIGAYNCVSDAVLLGTPASPSGDGWVRARQVVSGRLINGYVKGDWVLAFLYRYMEWKLSVAGLGPVMHVDGVENFDLSDIVGGHDEYIDVIDEIFTRIKFY